jgi:hypothetical protein
MFEAAIGRSGAPALHARDGAEAARGEAERAPHADPSSWQESERPREEGTRPGKGLVRSPRRRRPDARATMATCFIPSSVDKKDAVF